LVESAERRVCEGVRPPMPPRTCAPGLTRAHQSNYPQRVERREASGQAEAGCGPGGACEDV
jgi:hypothetical protein